MKVVLLLTALTGLLFPIQSAHAQSSLADSADVRALSSETYRRPETIPVGDGMCMYTWTRYSVPGDPYIGEIEYSEYSNQCPEGYHCPEPNSLVEPRDSDIFAYPESNVGTSGWKLYICIEDDDSDDGKSVVSDYISRK